MRKQTAKRVNVNLTAKQLDELKFIESCKTGDKYIDSDIIRDAIDIYAQLLGYNGQKFEIRQAEEDDGLPF